MGKENHSFEMRRCIMLFVSFLTPIGGTPKDRVARRLEWDYPEDVRLVAEYWLQNSDPTAIVIFEADNVLAMEISRVYWGDFFEITTVPAMTGEDGMAFVRSMMKK
jgi:hypothetical protein